MANGSSPSGTTRRVGLIVDDDSNPFEMACACEVLGIRRAAELGFEPYTLEVVAAVPRVTMRYGMFDLIPRAGLEALDRVDTVIVPNRPDVTGPVRASVLDAVRAAHRRGARLVGLCTGGFTLADAGVLDGRRATVHWKLFDEFARRYPAVELERDVLFVDDGDVLTSAGSAAALDLLLHLVRLDHGIRVANAISRRLVYSAYRDGGQRQFVERPVPVAEGASLAPTLEWASSRLAEELTVASLARHAHLSPTSLFRRFREELGTTPLGWLTVQRVAAAQQLLETTALPIEHVAQLAGIGSAANLRSVMRRHSGTTPSAYRRMFGGRGRRASALAG